MAQEPLPNWLSMAVGAFTPSALALLAWWKFRTERGDKRSETTSDLRDRLRATMDAQSLAMYDRLEGENKRLSARLKEIEKDRDRGWDLARWWNSETHRVKHVLIGLIHAANLSLELAGKQPVRVPNFTLPNIEDPVVSHVDSEAAVDDEE